MPEHDSARPVPAERELAQLDRWSFRVLPGDRIGCDQVVMGTTGSFVVVFEGDGVPAGMHVPGLRRARRAAGKLKSHLGAIGSHVETTAVLCPRTYSVFAPRTVRGVRIVPPGLLAAEISERNRAAQPHQVRHAAEALTRSFERLR
jgi:hypothetical protein